jgi:pimeloyl-ACP methyl ester carboxylesterase
MRRTPLDASLSINAEAVESVLRKASGKVHLIGHSAGAVIALSVALRKQVPLASLVTIEPPVPMLLKASGEDQHYDVFRNMTDAYISDFESGRSSLPLSIVAASVQASIPCFTQIGTATVRIRPPLPRR